MTFSKAQMSAWDQEYFDHMDALIDELTERQWREGQAEEITKRCMARKGERVCESLKHDDGRHIFKSLRSQQFFFEPEREGE